MDKEFKCDNGRVYKMPENHCVFCAKCTDIFYDFTNGPYGFLCVEGHDNCETCNSFIPDEDIEEKPSIDTDVSWREYLSKIESDLSRIKEIVVQRIKDYHSSKKG